jgi:hypothetical protein
LVIPRHPGKFFHLLVPGQLFLEYDSTSHFLFSAQGLQTKIISGQKKSYAYFVTLLPWCHKTFLKIFFCCKTFSFGRQGDLTGKKAE